MPRAAAMRQRAWPDSIITEEGMRHALESTPARGDLALFAFEESGEILGWAAAGRAWWEATPDAGTLQLSVEPGRRGEGIGAALAEAADAHLRRLGVRRTRAMSLDEPGARALAARRGFTELTAAAVSAVDPRTIEPLPVPDGIELVPLAGIDDARPIYDLDLELTQDIPHEEYDAIDFDEWLREYWRSPLVDDDASLVAYVDGELAGITMIRVDRPSGRAAEQPRWCSKEVPPPRPRAAAQVAQPPPRGGARRVDRDHRQRRVERADARRQHEAGLPALRAPTRMGALVRYQLTVSSMVVPPPDGRRTRKVYMPGGSGSNEALQ